MPIYEYRCSACGFQKEYLRKVSDPLFSVCPECSQETFGKMLTAAGFQLKGGGWYATDFKHPAKPNTPPAKAAADAQPKAGDSSAEKTAAKSETTKPASDATSTKSDAASAPSTSAATTTANS